MNFLFIFGVPIVVLRLVTDPVLSVIVIATGFGVPLAFTRTSSFAFKLGILREDADIQRGFANYWRALAQIDAR